MCSACCMKCILIFVNVIFAIIGTLFLAIGIFFKVGADDVIQPLLKSSFDSVKGLGSQLSVVGFDSSGSLDISSVTDILDPLAIVFIVMGAFLLAMCILGCVGVCCKIKIILWVYAAIVLALFLVQLIMVILFFTKSVDANIKEQLKKTINNDYKGTDSYETISVLWNLWHWQLKCCGVEGYTDFSKATTTNWKNPITATIAGVTRSVLLQTPLSCCKSDSSDATCAETPTAVNNNLNNGCWQALRDKVAAYEKIAIGVLAGMLALQLLCAIAAIVVGLKQQKDDEYA